MMKTSLGQYFSCRNHFNFYKQLDRKPFSGFYAFAFQLQSRVGTYRGIFIEILDDDRDIFIEIGLYVLKFCYYYWLNQVRSGV